MVAHLSELILPVLSTYSQLTRSVEPWLSTPERCYKVTTQSSHSNNSLLPNIEFISRHVGYPTIPSHPSPHTLDTVKMASVSNAKSAENHPGNTSVGASAIVDAERTTSAVGESTLSEGMKGAVSTASS